MEFEMAAHKKIFISYRREGGSDLAQLVYKDLITNLLLKLDQLLYFHLNINQ